jgi:hypothetical protein
MSYRTSTPFKTIYSPGTIFRNPKNHKPPDSGMQIMAPNHGYQFTNDPNDHYFLPILVQSNCLQRLEAVRNDCQARTFTWEAVIELAFSAPESHEMHLPSTQTSTVTCHLFQLMK